MALEGDFATIPFTDVLQLLGTTRKTGILHVRQGSSWRKLYLRDGLVVLVSSSDPVDSVGNSLVSCRKIREEDLRSARARQREERKLVGLILVEEGKCERALLLRYLHEKAYEIVARVATWDDGMFRFEEYAVASAEFVALDLSSSELLFEGVRRSDETARLKGIVPNEEVVLERVAGAAAADVDVSNQTMVGLVLGELAEPRRMKDLQSHLRKSEFSFLKSVRSLIEKGMVRIVATPPARPAVAGDEQWLKDVRKLILVGMFEAAITTLRDKLVGNPRHAVARSLLTRAEAGLVRDLTRTELPLAAVPELGLPLAALTERSLSPTEAFLLSRIGDVDIESLLDATPLPRAEILLSLARLVRSGYLRLRQPTPV